MPANPANKPEDVTFPTLNTWNTIPIDDDWIAEMTQHQMDEIYHAATGELPVIEVERQHYPLQVYERD